MSSPGKQHSCPLIIALLALLALSSGACRKQLPSPIHPATPELTGEPLHYSATVVRTVEGGERTEVRVARSGDMRREEWNQDGETRVSIWRPDLDRVFLLSLERQVYVESELAKYPQPRVTQRSPDSKATAGSSSGERSPSIYPEPIDHALGDESSPERVELEELPEQTVDGRLCGVLRRRATFGGGQVETTLTFFARDLDGLAVRVESETEGANGRVKIVTERRNIRKESPPETFVVPSTFKKVSSLDEDSG